MTDVTNKTKKNQFFQTIGLLDRIGLSPSDRCQGRAGWFGLIGFFSFFGDVGHFCSSGIGFLSFFGDVGHFFASCRAKVGHVTKKTNLLWS